MTQKEITSALLCFAFLATGACGRSENASAEPTNEPGAGEYAEDAAAAAGDTLEDAGEVIAGGVEDAADAIGVAIDKETDEFNALGLTVRNILDEEVRTRHGKIAARMEDLLFTADGQPAMAVLKEGGIFGVEDDMVIVTVQRLIVSEDNSGEVAVEITLSDEEIETLGDGVTFLPADFSAQGDMNTSLLSARKMLAAAVFNADNQKIADIYDFILDQQWRIDQVVVSAGGLDAIGDHLTAASWDMFALTDDMTALQTTALATDFDAQPRFRYDQLIQN